MRTTINPKELSKALTTMKPVVPSRPTPPILTHVELAADTNTLTMVGTDLDNAVRISIPATTQEPGRCVVNLRQLTDAARKDKSPAMELAATTTHLRVGSLSILLGDAESWPLVAFSFAPDSPPTFSTDLSSDLIVALSRAIPFAATDRTRPALLHTYLAFGDDTATVTATDGHSLYTSKLPCPGCTSGAPLIIPKLPVSFLAKLGGAWRMETDGTRALFHRNPGSGSDSTSSSSSITVATCLYTDPYPNWRQVIQKEHDHHATLSRANLIDALSALLPCAPAITHRMEYLFSADALTITAENADSGARGERILSCDYTDEPLLVSLNGEFMLRALKSLSGEAVTMAMGDARTAVVLHPGPALGDDFRLVMPLLRE